MPDRSQRELATEALVQLRVVSAGIDPAEDDLQFVLTRIPPLLKELAGREIVLVADYDAIPEEIFNALADLVAERIAPHFGGPYDPKGAETRIKEITALRAPYSELKFDAGLLW